MSNSESPLVLDPTAIAPLEHALRSGIVKEGDPSQRTWELVSLADGQVSAGEWEGQPVTFFWVYPDLATDFRGRGMRC